MAMVNMKDLLNHAFNNRYAVGAFEVVNLNFLQAVINAAERSRSPVILNIVEPHFEYHDVDLLMPAVIRAAKRASVPVAVQMDHCSKLETIQEGMRLGCNSVMFDAASESFTVNVERTREVVALAHACGIPVEGEIGYVTGMEGEEGEPDSSTPVYTPVEEAKAYIEKTGVDFLAVSIGTVHGRIKNKPRLDYSRLARIQEKAKVPFVIHGGTGLTEQQYRKLIDHGVAKINYFTVLAEINTRQIESNLKNKNMSYLQVYADVRAKMMDEVQRFMQVLNSAGRAAEVLIQCQPWRTLKHVILYNANTTDQSVIDETLTKGNEDFRKIPGVLSVDIGRAVGEKNRYRYCWIIRVANEDVLSTCKEHPIYRSYMDKYFKPLASEKITLDYAIVDDIG